jgi:hypothetical protein
MLDTRPCSTRRWRRRIPWFLAALCLTGLPSRAIDLPLAQLLRLGGEYVSAYEERFSAVVCEEEYAQRVYDRRGGRARSSRTLRSDIILVRVPGELRWLCFRDVYRVGGRDVRDREARLQELFLESPESAVEQARAILEESSRYNIGTTQRNFNVPTLPLVFLHPDNQHRFAFESAGSRKVAGRHCQLVEYRETARPTLIRLQPGASALPARGRLFIHKVDGAVLRSELALDIVPKPGLATVVEGLARITVDYRWVESLRLWLPREMNESYETRTLRNEAHRPPGSPAVLQGTEYVTGRARYKNYRRFDVQTQERYAVPDEPEPHRQP